MSDFEPVPRARLPLVIASGAILLAAFVAIAVGVSRAGSATPPPSPTATVAPTATPISTPCSNASFGAPLAALNQPSNVHHYAAAPPMTINTAKLYQATITTAKGAIVMCLEPSLAPVTVNNFVTLARNHFYDGIPFHRVVAQFVIQGGDPDCIGKVPAAPATPGTGCGSGGPGYSFKDETVKGKYTPGCVAMANSGPNTNGSQIFICIADDSSKLQPLYNLFGYVESGMDVAAQIVQGDVMQSVTVRQQM